MSKYDQEFPSLVDSSKNEQKISKLNASVFGSQRTEVELEEEEAMQLALAMSVSLAEITVPIVPADESEEREMDLNSEEVAIPLDTSKDEALARALLERDEKELDKSVEKDFAVACQLQDQWNTEDQEYEYWRQKAAQGTLLGVGKVHTTSDFDPNVFGGSWTPVTSQLVRQSFQSESKRGVETEWTQSADLLDTEDIDEDSEEEAETGNAAKLEKRFALDSGDMRGIHLNNDTFSRFADTRQRQSAQQWEKRQSKHERASFGRVVDETTRMVLYRWLNADVLYEVHGVVASGKESHIFFAVSGGRCHASDRVPNHAPFGTPLAIKVYDQRIDAFRNRAPYVEGEYRFRYAAVSNTRKIIQTWALKEFRNLMRLHASGIPCPRPHLLRKTLLIMDFIGKDEKPAPRLKDVEMDEDLAQELYIKVIEIMRKMFHVGKLVHADLSEYNLLYLDGDIFVIDVSQSVEHDHPLSLDLLRRDCLTIQKFFENRCPSLTRSAQALFRYVTMPEIPSDIVLESLDQLEQEVHAEDESEEANHEDDPVFLASHLPRLVKDLEYDSPFTPLLASVAGITTKSLTSSE